MLSAIVMQAKYIFTVYLLLAVTLTAEPLIAQQKNKLVEFKRFDQWEIWCIDIEQSGRVECNLNQVLRYKDHPDFRAMIVRFYTDGDEITKMLIEHEWQTSFSRGYLQVGDFEKISLSDCGKDCVLKGNQLVQVVEQFSADNQANIRFHDYLVQEFDIKLSLSSFAEALQSLKQMQKYYLGVQ